MNNGIAIGLALICLLLLIALYLITLFKWVLNEFQFFMALIAGINQKSDNQWKAIHQLQQLTCLRVSTHVDPIKPKDPNGGVRQG